MNKIFAVLALMLTCGIGSPSVFAQANEKLPPVISERSIPEFYKIIGISDVVSGPHRDVERHLLMRGSKHFVLNKMMQVDSRFTPGRIVKLYFIHRESVEVRPYLCTHDGANDLCYPVIRIYDDPAD